MPVMNGATAPPELPREPMIEREEIIIFGGMSLWRMWTAHGLIGPRRKPDRATETEAPGMEGTNQMTSSRRRA
jgi:hypothetical protein